MRVAAVDCGTNSVRLLIADLPDGVGWPARKLADGGVLSDLVRRMEIVRLGQGVDRTGRLDSRHRSRGRMGSHGRRSGRLHHDGPRRG